MHILCTTFARADDGHKADDGRAGEAPAHDGEVLRVERVVIGEDEARVVAGHRAGRPRLLADGARLGHLSGWIG